LKTLTPRIPIAQPAVSEIDVSKVEQALRSGWISGRGQCVKEFEERFAEWVGAEYAVASTSGTSALHLALSAAGISEKHEVIIPAFSMAAIPFAVSYTGARATLVDSEGETWNLDPNQLVEKISARTRALVVMHTYGHPAEMDPVLDIARAHDLVVVEDAAEAHGAEYKGRKVGGIGDIACFSFYANKIITTGEGGMVVTSNRQLAERARLLQNMAFRDTVAHRFEHECVAFNYRLTNLQAALGLAQLERIEQFITGRRERAAEYNARLKNVPGIQLPPEKPWAKNVYWMYSILVDKESYGLSRDELIAKLEAQGIESRPFFTPIHKQPFAEQHYRGQSYPTSERLAENGLNLPSGNTLTSDQVETVTNAISTLSRK